MRSYEKKTTEIPKYEFTNYEHESGSEFCFGIKKKEEDSNL